MRPICDFWKEDTEEIRERLSLDFDRVREIAANSEISGEKGEWFSKCARFLGLIEPLIAEIRSGAHDRKNRTELAAENAKLFADILPENYENSPANPAFAASVFGVECGQRMSMVAAELRGMIPYAFELRLEDAAIAMELFLELHGLYRMAESEGMSEASLTSQVKESVYYYVSDYSDQKKEKRIRESLDPEVSFAYDIVMESDLSDLRYLYRYGEYISENEIRTAEYLNSLSEEKIEVMAAAYANGYIEGFAIGGIDLSKKSVAEVRFPIGFERVVRSTIRRLEAQGLRIVMIRCPVHAGDGLNLDGGGYTSTRPNPQYLFDHVNDKALFLDKPYLQRVLDTTRMAYEKVKDLAAGFAGPAVMELFGELPFELVTKPEACALNAKQQKLAVSLASERMGIISRYIDFETRSFTIISFPTPAIGECYEAVFEEMIRINTLDSSQYKKIQQALIDALDSGVTVHIKGSGDNRTDLTVALWELKDPEKETIFENCLSDVNIPLGEVFTSPKLAGTNGILNVSDIYLYGIRYRDLWIRFKDGMITDYGCANDPDPAIGKELVHDYILNRHETLPLGEFAIGTNTTAYAMSRKYDILDRMQILVIEKMGPHFAVGDTCYSHAEERAVFNPDGKEIVARENACSLLRDTDPASAYFNCHTDITIPYCELGSIRVHRADGGEISLIENGRFVLPGTEALNGPLEEA